MLKCIGQIHLLQAKHDESAIMTKEHEDMKMCICDLEAEFSSAQKDLKEVVSGDLQLASALAEIRHLRARLKSVQAENLQVSAEVFHAFVNKFACSIHQRHVKQVYIVSIADFVMKLCHAEE